MEMYERYVDDSDQTAVVPPPGAVFNAPSNKVEIDENVSAMINFLLIFCLHFIILSTWN